MIKIVAVLISLAFLPNVTFANRIKEIQLEETRIFTLRELMWRDKLSEDDLVYIRKSLLAKDIASLTFAVSNLTSHQISFEKLPFEDKEIIDKFLHSIDESKPIDVLEFRSINSGNAKGVIDGVVLINKIRRKEMVPEKMPEKQPSEGVFAMLGKYAYLTPDEAVDDIIQATEDLSKFGLIETLYMEAIMAYPGFYEEKILAILRSKNRSDFGFLWLLGVGEAKAIVSKTFRKKFVDIVNREMGGKSAFIREQADLVKGRLKFQDELEASGESM